MHRAEGLAIRPCFRRRMDRRLRRLDEAGSPAWFPLALAVVLLSAGTAGGQEKAGYNQSIRPILADRCFACHGRDESHRQADLRLDTAGGATDGNSGDPAIVPGDPENSLLWQRINSADESLLMPPPESHKVLTAGEKELLRKWILDGAVYQQHWAFEPLSGAVPPEGPDPSKHPIDRFLENGSGVPDLPRTGPADPSTLLRRLAFALTGLPPSAEDLRLWVEDQTPGSLERMVERYLASPHYGEEMARHWLDVARFADTHGLHLDNERQMWAYRDWVVRSFNRNQPFDEFTIEQLAGDLLPNPTQDQLIATGFNRCNVTTSEGGAIDAEFHFRYAVDRTSTMAQTWLGLTAGCAVCHDHKFDPISAKEFYSLYAFFYSAADPAMDGNALLTNPVLKLESDADREKLAEFDRQLAGLRRELESQAAAIEYRDPALDPSPAAPSTLETVWLEDDFPPGGRIVSGPGQGTVFVSAGEGEKVFSGERALKRTNSGLSQDVWEQAAAPLVVPADAKIFAYVFLEPENLPQSIMLQFFKGGWLHRAVWGNYDVIPWGTPNTTERVGMGELPEAGSWVRLEVPAEKIGLAAGDQLTGFATTQFGGTVYWDRVGAAGLVDPARDPQHSFTAWWKQAAGRDTPGLDAELNAVAKSGPEAESDPAVTGRLRNHYLVSVCLETKTRFEPAVAEIRRIESARQAWHDAIPSTFIFSDLQKPRDSFVMLRGQYDQPGEKVEPGVPAVLPPLRPATEGAPANRMDLARWLVADDNPLTARVTVNRFWQQFFGTGLVRSSGDFGTQGELPSHPELLDWLAAEFRDSGWDVKQLVRLIVTSSAFRRSSAVSAGLLERDPENRWLARGPRLRLDAEQIRDNVLAVSGLLDRTMGGKGVKPYQPVNIWEPVGYTDSNTRHYRQDTGAALYRRSLYTFYKRTAPPPFMVNFDAPNREQSCTRRERSNTPLQALQLLNDVQHVEAARNLAQRMITEGGETTRERIGFLFRTVLSREPDSVELDVLTRQFAEHLGRYSENPADAVLLVEQGESRPPSGHAAPELAAFTLIAGTVLNLDETLTRN